MNSTVDIFDLDRFINAQKRDYSIALNELSQGHKYSHWMWYIFPQINGLGRSDIAQKYAIRNEAEVKAYLAHSILGKRLVECSEVLLSLNGFLASDIFGYPDDVKLRSSMTLFANYSECNSVFHQVIENYFDGKFDEKTIKILNK